MSKSQLNPSQIVQKVYNEADESVNVTLTSAELELSAEDGDSVVAWSGDAPAGYDYYSQTLSNTDKTVTTVYKSGGASGTTLGTVVRVYSDNTRTFLVSFTRS